MNQCLRCGKACEQDLFCENCQSALLHRSLQRQGMHEALAQASLGVHVSLAELGSRENSALDLAKQTSSFIPAQDVISNREQNELCDISDKATLSAEQSARLAISQAPSLQHRRLSRLKSIFAVLIILTIIALVTDCVLVFLVVYRHQSHDDSNHNQNVPMTVVASSSQSARSANGSSPPLGGISNNSHRLGATPTARPALGISSMSLTFSITRGEEDPPSQAVTVVNTGGDLLSWQVHVDPAASFWLQVSPETGSVASGQNGQIFLSVDTDSLSLGRYRSNVVVSATDKSGTRVSGSPQVVTVVLNVLPPCTLEVTPMGLTFSSSLLAPESSGQDITLQTGGNCVYPVMWTATVDTGSRSWLLLSATSGQDSGDGSVITVHVNTGGMLLGSYRGQISVSAVDSNNASVRNPTPTVEVQLTVIG